MKTDEQGQPQQQHSQEITSIRLQAYTAAEIRAVLSFIYTGKVDAKRLEESAPRLLKVASELEIATLKDYLVSYLLDKVTAENVLELAQLAGGNQALLKV